MVARLLFSALTSCLVTLVAAGIVPLSASQAAGMAPGVERAHAHAVFRVVDTGPLPLRHALGASAERAATGIAGRHAVRQASAFPARRGLQGNTEFPSRAGARKAVPVTRGQELGLRFRPDERESPYGRSAGTQPGVAAPAELESQFRPTERRRKPTYEELYAEPAVPVQPPVMPYPMLAPPLPAYGSPWPAW